LVGKDALKLTDAPQYLQCAGMVVDPDRWIEQVKQCRYLPEDHMRILCQMVRSRLVKLPNVIEMQSPVTICGDIHGQFLDLLELLRTAGEPPNNKLLFLGDYVDRGKFSLETITLLFCLFVRYPDHVTLLRGNHETRKISSSYGFLMEIEQKYGGSAVWHECCKTFDLLPISAMIDKKIMAVHGGLSPEVCTMERMNEITRAMEVPNYGPLADILWSDPEERLSGWYLSPRGAGYLFGSSVVEKFCHINSVDLICRSHQLVQEGFAYSFNRKLCTVWSAPNYVNRCDNKASVLLVDGNGEPRPKYFIAHANVAAQWPDREITPYFL